ncbi:DNA-binding MarR family transcriptional regulator [Fontibacillus phaseoli]|uniref:DNA-binding MarR family transcriptional regulator n=1 Tax=Fontibacillus phaseoli TaxID=1416533 RepID=A0A369BAW4_9BACL|nr:MarR family transcriptional regulator [Fontibacillus phaseoli]RCX18662.1 DNA-binding MarR family transcriptional regulator [Fontibacillus phaseoli]
MSTELEMQRKQAYIFGGILTLANRMQLLGDKLDEKMTMKQWLLIAVIMKCENPSPTISEVAEMTGNSRQNVKKMALILEKQGFLELAKDPRDARIVRLRLTPKCLSYFENRKDQEERFMASLFEAFDEEVTNGIYHGLNRLVENIARMENDHGEEERG